MNLNQQIHSDRLISIYALPLQTSKFVSASVWKCQKLNTWQRHSPELSISAQTADLRIRFDFDKRETETHLALRVTDSTDTDFSPKLQSGHSDASTCAPELLRTFCHLWPYRVNSVKSFRSYHFVFFYKFDSTPQMTIARASSTRVESPSHQIHQGASAVHSAAVRWLRDSAQVTEGQQETEKNAIG